MLTRREGRWFKVPLWLGGLGSLACALCCALPLLGAAGLGAAGLGVAAFSRVLEPLSMGLLGASAIVLGATFVRRRLAHRGPAHPGRSCAVDGSCGCAPISKSAAAGE